MVQSCTWEPHGQLTVQDFKDLIMQDYQALISLKNVYHDFKKFLFCCLNITL